MLNTIRAALAAFKRLLRPAADDVDSIIASFVTTQAKLATLVGREEALLSSEAATVHALLLKQVERNATVNRAYRVIHRLDQLTA